MARAALRDNKMFYTSRMPRFSLYFIVGGRDASDAVYI